VDYELGGSKQLSFLKRKARKHVSEASLVRRGAVRDWTGLSAALIGRTVLTLVALMFLWAMVPTVFGWHTTTTMSGSMEPKVMTGDVVVSMPYDGDKVIPGQVILAPDPAHPDRLRFHRVLKSGESKTVITKGDNNPQADSDPIPRSAIIGVGVIRIPYLGLPNVWLQNHQWLPLGFTALWIPILIWLSRRDLYLKAQFKELHRRELLKQGKSEHRFIRQLKTKAPRWLTQSAPALKTLTSIGVVLVLVFSLVTVKGAQSVYSYILSNTGNIAQTSDRFACYGTDTGTGAWDFNENPVSPYASVPSGSSKALDSSGDGNFGDLTLTNVTKINGSCTTAPYVKLNGTSSVMYSAKAYAGVIQALNAYVRTSVKSKAMTIGSLSSVAGTGSSASGVTSFIIWMDANGKLNVGSRYTQTTTVLTQDRDALVCDTVVWSGNSTLLNNGAWHNVSASLVQSTTSGLGIRMYVDGVAQTIFFPSTKSGKPRTFTASYAKWGYDPGLSTCMASAVGTLPARWSGDLDDLGVQGSDAAVVDATHK